MLRKKREARQKEQGPSSDAGIDSDLDDVERESCMRPLRSTWGSKYVLLSDLCLTSSSRNTIPTRARNLNVARCVRAPNANRAASI